MDAQDVGWLAGLVGLFEAVERIRKSVSAGRVFLVCVHGGVCVFRVRGCKAAKARAVMVM